MGQNAQQVRVDIARARDDLGQTLDAIGDKVSPKLAVRRKTERVREALTNARHRVMGSASDAGSTLADNASSLGLSMRETAAGAAETIGDTASHAVEAVRDMHLQGWGGCIDKLEAMLAA